MAELQIATMTLKYLAGMATLAINQKNDEFAIIIRVHLYKLTLVHAHPMHAGDDLPR